MSAFEVLTRRRVSPRMPSPIFRLSGASAPTLSILVLGHRGPRQPAATWNKASARNMFIRKRLNEGPPSRRQRLFDNPEVAEAPEKRPPPVVRSEYRFERRGDRRGPAGNVEGFSSGMTSDTVPRPRMPLPIFRLSGASAPSLSILGSGAPRTAPTGGNEEYSSSPQRAHQKSFERGTAIAAAASV